MRPPSELPTHLLDGRLAAPHEPEDAQLAARITQIAQLADRGDHPAAARDAAALLEAQSYDVRLIAFYLFGVFLERGPVELPALLDRMAALVTHDLAALRPARRTLQVMNSTAAWLAEHLSAHLQFHAKQRDAVWDAWRGQLDPALPDAIASGCAALTLALESVIEAPLAVVPLARIRRWAHEDLRRSLARRDAAAEAAPSPIGLAGSAARGGAAPAERADPPPRDRSDRRSQSAHSAQNARSTQRAQRAQSAALPDDPVDDWRDDRSGDSLNRPTPDERSGDQGDDQSGDQGDDQSGDQGDGRSGDRGDDRSDDRGDDRADDQGGDRGDDRAGDRGDDRAGDRGDDRGDDLPDDLPDGGSDPIVDRFAGRDRSTRTASPGDPVAVGSPALAVLQAKLRGFHDLVARRELAKAAIVASDIRSVITHFDPVAFFPSMFAAYFKALHQIVDELAPYFDGVDLPSWHALDAYYRADMRAFFDD
jgi:hypothetical protein